MKCCSKCLKNKIESEFYKATRYKDGLLSFCKECKKQQSKDYHKNNSEYRHIKKVEYYQLHKSECLAKSADYYAVNSEKLKIASSKWRRSNPETHCVLQAKRRSDKLNATPKWLTIKQLQDIALVYKMAKELQWLSEDKLEVDHIVPLNGKNVCGLHVSWNLQILPKKLNLIKSNKV
jgi:hypothetical protein